jgi:outer membrane protein OmpA-like peptidoglycan-associated protein
MTVNVSERMVLTGDDKCGYLATGGTRLDNCAKAMLNDVSVRMKNEPQLRANIIGYTDASRSETSKKNLGQNRAKAVADYLVSKGIEASRLTGTDGGTNNPAGNNSNTAGRKKNRRVETEFSVR